MITDEQKARINKIISDIDTGLSRIDKGVLQAQEAENLFAICLSNSQSIFVTPSDEWRIIDRWKNENGYNWSLTQRSGTYAGPQQKEKLEKLRSKLETITPAISVSFPTNEVHFSENEGYEAKRLICNTLRSAGSSVLVLDEHLDDQFFDYIDILSNNINIRVITGERKPIFWKLLDELRKNRSNIEARVNSISHCRYIVIDGSTVYSTDASLNTIGKKAFMIHRLSDGEKVNAEIEQYWNNGKIK